MTSGPAEDQRLRDLKLLRRVRDRMDREYAQPLDVEALARGVNMSAGHLSRQFKLAYGESPYSYLMTRRIERAMALLRRGDMSVTEVCFAVGCSSLGTFSTRFTELVGMPPSTYREQTAGVTAGMPSCVEKQVTRPIRNREAPVTALAPSVSVMDITHSLELPPARRPGRIPGVLPRRPRLRGPPRRRMRQDALDHGRSAEPARTSTSSCIRRPPTPGITDDERRIIAEMMAKGTFGTLLLATKDLDGTFERVQAGDVESRPGADRAAVRRSRLRPPRSRRQHGPHPGAALNHADQAQGEAADRRQP